MIMEKCPKCNQMKSIEEFNKNRRRKNGLDSYCRDCRCSYMDTYRKGESILSSLDYPRRVKYVSETEKICTQCNQVKNIAEFNRKSSNRDGLRANCKDCQRIGELRYEARLIKEGRLSPRQGRGKDRSRETKARLVELLGGACRRCSYSEFLAALEFHHVNPSEKKHLVNRLGDEIRKIQEADKCVLLCANCHRGLEAGYWSGEFIKRDSCGYDLKK